MSDTQLLIGRIAALRQRLEEAREQTTPERRHIGVAALADLRRQVASGAEHAALLDASLRQLPDTTAPGENAVLPTRLTARARRVLEQGRELLARLRTQGESIDPPLASRSVLTDDPLVRMYRDTAAMTNTTLRMLQALPDAPSVQLRLCEGIEPMLSDVAQRLATLTLLTERRRREQEQLDQLAELLTALADEKTSDIGPFATIAEALLAAAQGCAPLKWVGAEPRDAARFIAAHSLNTAQVMARLVRHDAELRSRPVELVLAALVHDVGMLRVPVEILTSTTPLDDDARRRIEGHSRVGADLVAPLLPRGSWLSEMTASHHERLDGAGYPDGLRESQIARMTRLLAVCDVYAALVSPRPYRPAREPRTALTDTLLLAEQGALDRQQAEHLLQLSFYPVGTAVELSDGAVGVVIAVHPTDRDLHAPARPVLALLTDRQGRSLPMPRYIDLAQSEGHGIVRTLPADERRRLLGTHYPEFAQQ